MHAGPLGPPPKLGVPDLLADLPKLFANAGLPPPTTGPQSSGFGPQGSAGAAPHLPAPPPLAGGAPQGFGWSQDLLGPQASAGTAPKLQAPPPLAGGAPQGFGWSQDLTNGGTLSQPALSHLGLPSHYGERFAPTQEYCESCGNLLMVDSFHCRKCGKARPPPTEHPEVASPARSAPNGRVEGLRGGPVAASPAPLLADTHVSSLMPAPVSGAWQVPHPGMAGSIPPAAPPGHQPTPCELIGSIPPAGPPPTSGPLGVSIPSTGPQPTPSPPGVFPHPPSAARPPAGMLPPPGGPPPTCPPSLVPVEYANAKLWGVTSEYENLLNIQSDQNQFALRQREAEIMHLKRCVDMLENGRVDEDSVAAHLRAKEEEIALSIEAKQRELDLLSNLLRMRDSQIADLQQLCEQRAMQLRQVTEADERRHAQERAGGRAALGEALEEAARLRMEKAELEQLVVAKERQLGVVHSVDPHLSDTSALQLGAQAIQMFHDSMRMRADAAKSEDQTEELRTEAERLRVQVEDLEAAAEDKRDEMREITGALAAKMKRIIALETEVEELRRDHRNSMKEASGHVEKLQAELQESREVDSSKQGFVEQLRDELQDKNQRMLQQQEELMQCKQNSKRLEEKVKELTAQVANAEEALAQMLRSTTHKDQLFREMTEQVNISESKLHAYQINEVLGARQKQLEQRCKETDLTQSLREKEALVGKLASELAKTRSKSVRGSDTEDNDAANVPSISASGLTVPGISGSSTGLGIGQVRRMSSGGLLPGSSTLARSAFPTNHELDVTGTSNWIFESGIATPGMPVGSQPNSPRGSSRGISVSPTPNSYRSHQVSHLYGVPRMTPAPSFWNGSTIDDRPGDNLNVKIVNVRKAHDGESSAAVSSMLGPTAEFTAPPSLFTAPPSFQMPPVVMPSLPTLHSIHAQNLGLSEPVSAPPAILQPSGYWPQPGDPIDARVAEFVNQPHNAQCKPLFCRLNEGNYLFGTHRTQLRVEQLTGQLEALDDNSWIPMEDFVRRRAGSQMVHLKQASVEVGSSAALPGGTM